MTNSLTLVGHEIVQSRDNVNFLSGFMTLEKSLNFFDLAHQHFSASLTRTRQVKKYYHLAGFTVCLHFAGEVLVDFLTSALCHLETEPTMSCDLTIGIWDSASTDVPPMEFPWANGAFTMHGSVVGYNCERIHTVFDPRLHILQLFDHERSVALYWVKDRGKCPWWVGASPFQFILHWWMKTRKHQLTHAGAVGYSNGGVLFAGKSGAGKSTTALSCMKAGMKYVSEDYCLLSDLPQIRAYSVYNSAKITEKTLSLFPELGKHIENPERPKGDKACVFHYKFQPQNILFSFPLKGLLTLKIFDSKDSWIEPIDPKEAVASLAGTTLWQLANTGPSVFHHLKRVAEAVPCYRLHLGRDLTQPPKLIEKLCLS